MGLFKKKSDPISDRARALNSEIAALEARIKKLSARQEQAPAPSNNHTEPEPPVPAQASGPQPRLRSTALPYHRNTVPPPPAPPTHEPVFEEVNQDRLQKQTQPSESRNDLGVRKNDLKSFWQRLKNHFRGPPASNPKLVNYLAAGSIQGLRPLRYERRVARNRFIVLVVCLVLVLWGLIAIFMKHR
jgi:hypothetical protein